MEKTISLLVFSIMVFILAYSLGARVGFQTASEACRAYCEDIK